MLQLASILFIIILANVAGAALPDACQTDGPQKKKWQTLTAAELTTKVDQLNEFTEPEIDQMATNLKTDPEANAVDAAKAAQQCFGYRGMLFKLITEKLKAGVASSEEKLLLVKAARKLVTDPKTPGYFNLAVDASRFLNLLKILRPTSSDLKDVEKLHREIAKAAKASHDRTAKQFAKDPLKAIPADASQDDQIRILKKSKEFQKAKKSMVKDIDRAQAFRKRLLEMIDKTLPATTESDPGLESSGS